MLHKKILEIFLVKGRASSYISDILFALPLAVGPVVSVSCQKQQMLQKIAIEKGTQNVDET